MDSRVVKKGFSYAELVRITFSFLRVVCDIDLTCVSLCEVHKDDWTLVNHGLYDERSKYDNERSAEC